MLVLFSDKKKTALNFHISKIEHWPYYSVGIKEIQESESGSVCQDFFLQEAKKTALDCC